MRALFVYVFVRARHLFICVIVKSNDEYVLTVARTIGEDDCYSEMVRKVICGAADDARVEAHRVHSDGILLDSIVAADEFALA